MNKQNKNKISPLLLLSCPGNAMNMIKIPFHLHDVSEIIPSQTPHKIKQKTNKTKQNLPLLLSSQPGCAIKFLSLSMQKQFLCAMLSA